ncbi:MAG: molybdenum cofactor biosynthesis protein, partial [Methanomicrobiales archaeon]|nr:molybdenum cofactor biosynthesis protein [Methanomicrobiales archaeon]
FIEKRIDGFGEIFRWRSYQEIGTPAILSRALAGIIDKKAVFCIPGSPNAARLAVRSIILPEIAHILTHAGR